MPKATASAAGRAIVAAVAQDFAEFECDPAVADPLSWPGYRDDLRRARERSGADESVVCGEAVVGGTEAVLIVFDFGFMGGSVGVVSAARITAAFAHAARRRIPVVSLVASGGCRMQEGMAALVGMQRIAGAASAARAAGIPHVAVLCDPTTGGIWASLAAGADVILAVAGATIAFAGHRVRGHDDSAAFTAEGKLEHGQVDRVVGPAELPSALASTLEIITAGRGRPAAPAEVPAPLGRRDSAPDGWAAVRRARDLGRPRAGAYLDAFFDARVPLQGDRAGGRDPGMLCGIGRRRGRAIAYAAQTGTPTTAVGLRTAARVVRLADRLGIPLLTLVDTPGAANDDAAERAGIGPAVAALLGAMTAVKVPVTTLVIGEGGSGGALALCSPDDLWLTGDSYFSVIAPEAATAILKRPVDDAPLLANRQRVSPRELVDMGLARGVV